MNIQPHVVAEAGLDHYGSTPRTSSTISVMTLPYIRLHVKLLPAALTLE